MGTFLVHFSNCEGDSCQIEIEADSAEEAQGEALRHIDESIRIEEVEEVG